jgi:hypothetical protein
MAITGHVEKQPSETFIVGVDFSKELATGEMISTATVTARDARTGADTTATILAGSPTISGSQVTRRVAAAGVNGDRHILEFRVTTSNGNVFEAEIDLAIRSY